MNERKTIERRKYAHYVKKEGKGRKRAQKEGKRMEGGRRAKFVEGRIMREAGLCGRKEEPCEKE
jgi:hypothetical protein